ncbi:hypothetical protein L484_003027 [Morus notabilis]|uniref:Uncharacterized protein n=1 Tax=Morus notabilis TaxID=981085 RepID=W9RA14_9ROSA|nr:hypothetical protein L484_003027 [Morus notabilis]
MAMWVKMDLACHLNPKEMVLVNESADDENSQTKKRRRKRGKGKGKGKLVEDPDNCFTSLDNNAVRCNSNTRDCGSCQCNWR